MAMLISKFHKLIQSKVIWYIFLGAIIVAFVGLFTPGLRGGDGGRGKSRPVGELFGKEVSREEYSSAYRGTFLWYVLQSGQMLQRTPELTAALEAEAWQRIAALRKARADKILVTNQEVVEAIQSERVFLHPETGAFDTRLYKGTLDALGVSPQTIEQMYREQLAINKLLFGPVQGALVAPYELRRAYRVYTDRLVLQYAVLPRARAEAGVSVTDEEARALFEANSEPFRMPAKVMVSYVEFPVADFLAEVAVPEGLAERVYTENLENYRVESTNVLVEYTPFEEVESEITEEVKMAMARKLAAEKATEFVVDVSPKAEGEEPCFAETAAAADMKIKRLPAFASAEKLAGIDEAAPFRQAAFGLQDDPYASFSDAIVGKDTVYVLHLEKQYPSFIPAYDAVKDEVMEAAGMQAAFDALAGLAEEVHQSVADALAEGSGFEQALDAHNLTAETTEEFDLSSPPDSPYADTLLRTCLTAEAGELCPAAGVPEGVLLVYVSARTPMDASIGLPAIRGELAAGLSRQRAQRLVAGWQKALLEEAEFKDFFAEAVAE